MPQVPDVSQNGIIDASLISSVITSLNNMNNWLEQLGYGNSNNGLLYTARYNLGAPNVASGRDVVPADDFRIFSVSKQVRIKSGTTNQGVVTIPQYSGYSFKGAIVSAECDDVPVIAAVKSQTATEIQIFVRTLTAPSAATTAWINVMSPVISNNQDSGIT